VSGTENNTQNQKPRVSKLATFSIVCFYAAIISGFSAGVMYKGKMSACVLITLILAISLAVTSWTCAICGIVVIKKSKGKLKGLTGCIATILLTCLIVFATYGNNHAKNKAKQIICQCNLENIYRVINKYTTTNNDTYPTANQWCDLLILKTNDRDRSYLCIQWRQQRDTKICSYAMNPNCKVSSPPDTVFLFETKDGWNLCGGPELLATDNHKYQGKGTNVLFNNGNVEFVPEERFGELKWK